MKTIITRENYEEFVIDFVENNLGVEEHEAMLSFLNLHPDLADEVMSFRNMKLTADTDVVFGDKDLLLMDTSTKVMWMRVMSIAAASILLLGVGLWYWGQSDIDVEGGGDKVMYASEEPKVQPAQIERTFVEPSEAIGKQEVQASADLVEVIEDNPQENIIPINTTSIKKTKREETLAVSQQNHKVIKTATVRPIIEQPVVETLSKQHDLIAHVDPLQYAPMNLEQKESLTIPIDPQIDPYTISRDIGLRRITNSELFGTVAFSNVGISLIPELVNMEVELLPSYMDEEKVKGRIQTIKSKIKKQ